MGIVSVGTKAFDKNVSGNIISIAYIDAENTDFAAKAKNANSHLKQQPTNIINPIQAMTFKNPGLYPIIAPTMNTTAPAMA